jgi:hypothetical protein
MDIHFVGLGEIAEALGVATAVMAVPRSSIPAACWTPANGDRSAMIIG